MEYTSDVEAVDAMAQSYKDLKKEIGKVIVGQDDVVKAVIIALFSNGHSLLVGVPGLAKTLLVSTIAEVLDLDFKRIQFTPDLMPSDITGSEILDEDRHFKFNRGPLFSNIVLADEINRTPPKTQAALLEAMQERSVTVSGTRHELPKPFFVLATQNPVELEGTFPLPEAQVDRFLMRIGLGYPGREDERQILRRFRTSNPLVELGAVISTDDVQRANRACREVYVHPVLEDYLLDLVAATRKDSAFALGVSPRGSLALYRTAQAAAAISGRAYVIPDDIKRMALPVLAHRLAPSIEARLHSQSPGDRLAALLAQTPVPVEEVWTARA